MTKKEFLNLKDGEYITAVISGTNRNGEKVKRIDIFKYEYCEFRTIKEKTVFIRGLEIEFNALNKTTESDFKELESQENERHEQALKNIKRKLDNFKESKK